MALLLIALTTCSILAVVAVRADRRFAGVRSLPMQWGLNGRPTWSAPRRLALAFSPVLTAIVYAALIVVDRSGGMRFDREHMMLPGFLAIGVTTIGIQQLHLWLARRTLKR